MRGRWFITPSARQQWRRDIDPRPLSDEDIDDEIHAWCEKANRRAIQDNAMGLTSFRVTSLKVTFLVDETERPRAALVAVNKPHASFRPGSFQPLTHTDQPRRPGRPRSVTQPGEPISEGRPQIKERVPRDVAEWVANRQAVEPGYLLNLVREDMRRHARR